MDLRKELFSNQDLKYKEFSKKLIPGSDNIIGVRTPVLRTISKSIAKSEGRTFLDSYVPEFHEERLVYGFVITYTKMDIDERICYLKKYIPFIDNWALCDQVSIKLTDSEKEPFWNFICGCLQSSGEYEKRFGVVNLMKFLDDKHIDEVLEKLETVEHEGYYLKMGVAWAVSIAFTKYPEKTMDFLKNCRLDDFTYNKSLQKITESYRVSKDVKKIIRTMKR